jgi:alkylhydroperoxidase/carboxymuconolactone decarboxylase family protein YurZ
MADHDSGDKLPRRWMELMRAYDRARFDVMSSRATGKDGSALAPRIRALIYVAADLQTAHLYPDGAELNMREAMKHGATVEEISEVLGIAATTTYQPFARCLRAALREFELDGDAAPTDAHESLRRAFADYWGFVPEWLDFAIAVLPGIVPGLLSYVSMPQRAPALDEKARALIFVGLNASPPISDVDAVAQWGRRCKEAGATAAEIAEAVAAGAMIGTHSFTRGYPVLHFALQDHRDRHNLGYC